jgi:hypothetical protein
MTSGASRDIDQGSGNEPVYEDAEAAGADTSGPDASVPETSVGGGSPHSAGQSGPRRSWPGAALRAVVVLVVAGIGYQLVVPTTPTVRHRLSRLVVASTGVATFAGRPTTSASEPSTTAAVAAVEAAAKAHPSATGIWLSSWTTKVSTQDGLAMAVFLLPDAATAAKARSQLQSTQLSAAAFQSSGLVRSAQFTPSGIPGAAGAVYTPAKAAKAPGQAALTIWQQGRTVVLVEVALVAGAPQAMVTTASQTEATNLDRELPGFSLTVTHYPMTASIVWIAGSLLILLLAAGGPLAVRRRRARRARAIEEELARTIRVGSSTIVRKRRDA